MTTSIFEPSRVQVRRYIDRAESQFGISRKEIVTHLGVSSPAVSNWCADNDQQKISMEQIPSFAEITKMAQDEIAMLVFTVLMEREGKGVTVDGDLLAQSFAFALGPPPNEEVVLDAYRRSMGELRIDLTQDKYMIKSLDQAFQKVADEWLAEKII